MQYTLQISYTITGKAQNRINALMAKYSPKHTAVIWIASLSCLCVPLLVFKNNLSSIMLSGLFGSAFITFWILNLGLRYAVHKRFSLHYQPELELETRILQLEDNGIRIDSSLLKPAFRPYRQIKAIVVEDNIIIISGKNGWIEMIPRDCIIEGNSGFLLEQISQKSGKSAKNPN
ncbi:hypothetical protein [Endozoicomonas ascidiicola]|uniref:hypothetical protein n=1 Tax=Endozoicomonas ascidiicola TaxID=1698521 RepID=UPI000836E9EE|nr:hypothetical protein [Endozoicomonas ascidiicola]